jgi:uncharacterized cupin superfamily protein
MVVTTSDRPDLERGALKPEQILAGTPATRWLTVAESPDEALSVALWECTPGSFRWHFYSDEVVHLLAGEVEITDQTGRVAVLVAGSVAFFVAGSDSVWVVRRTIRKLAVFRSPPPSLPRRLLDALARRR